MGVHTVSERQPVRLSGTNQSGTRSFSVIFVHMNSFTIVLVIPNEIVWDFLFVCFFFPHRCIGTAKLAAAVTALSCGKVTD